MTDKSWHAHVVQEMKRLEAEVERLKASLHKARNDTLDAANAVDYERRKCDRLNANLAAMTASRDQWMRAAEQHRRDLAAPDAPRRFRWVDGVDRTHYGMQLPSGRWVSDMGGLLSGSLMPPAAAITWLDPAPVDPGSPLRFRFPSFDGVRSYFRHGCYFPHTHCWTTDMGIAKFAIPSMSGLEWIDPAPEPEELRRLRLIVAMTERTEQPPAPPPSGPEAPAQPG